MKLGPNQKKWIKALRSGKYRRGKALLRVNLGDSKGFGYCCLGVACIAGICDSKISEMGWFESIDSYGNMNIAFLLEFNKLGLRDAMGSIIRNKKSPAFAKWLKKHKRYFLNGNGIDSLVELNDQLKYNYQFKIIADFIETFPELVFVKSI